MSKQPDKQEINKIVTSSLQNILSQKKGAVLDNNQENIFLIGAQSVLDSLGLVTLIIDVEQKLATQHNLSITLANDRAMSQKNSPFRTTQTLADYIELLIKEEAK